MQSPIILSLDRNRQNQRLLARFLQREGQILHSAESYSESLQVIAQQDVLLALLDLSGFDEGIWQLCDHLAQQQIAFVLIAARPHPQLQEMGLSHGALNVMVKPIQLPVLRSLIRTCLRLR